MHHLAFIRTRSRSRSRRAPATSCMQCAIALSDSRTTLGKRASFRHRHHRHCVGNVAAHCRREMRCLFFVSACFAGNLANNLEPTGRPTKPTKVDKVHASSSATSHGAERRSILMCKVFARRPHQIGAVSCSAILIARVQCICLPGRKRVQRVYLSLRLCAVADRRIENNNHSVPMFRCVCL